MPQRLLVRRYAEIEIELRFLDVKMIAVMLVCFACLRLEEDRCRKWTFLTPGVRPGLLLEEWCTFSIDDL